MTSQKMTKKMNKLIIESKIYFFHMKNFLVGWLVWQLLIVGIVSGVLASETPAESARTVNCSNGLIEVGYIVVYVAVPLMAFVPNIGSRSCTQ